MISRRHIRVKVMQSVYALTNAHSDNLVKEEKFIRHSIDKMYDLYVLNMQLLVELQGLAAKLYESSLNKQLKVTQERPNSKFVDNKALNILVQSSSLASHFEENDLNLWKEHDEYVRVVYDLMIDSELYAKYMNSGTSSFKEDSKFIADLFTQIIAPNEKLADFYEDSFIGWVDDIPFVNTWVLRSLKELKMTNAYILPSLYKNAEDEDFAVALFRKVVLNQEKYKQEIVEKTPNWEIERIADLDIIILMMGISEFLEFPSIPTRVTINECIELAKDYSTDKSGYFVNGVLDKIQKDFSESKRLNKIGRGLL
ncbi:MAG: transcription antitermination factor NusB [Flavobacteriaceae bacterium]